MSKKDKITVQGTEITVISEKNNDYICLTDMVKGQEGEDHIRNWMRNRNTLEFLGAWEMLHNPTFKGVEFDTFLHEAGANRFNMTPRKWIDAKTKNILSLFFLVSILLCCNGTNQVREVYKSETLVINQISKYTYQHISFLITADFGKVPCNGMIVTNKNEAVVFDTPCDNETSSELIDWITKSLHHNITAIIPTHYHVDNLGGLDEFHSRGIPSFAYNKTIQIAKENAYPVPQNGFDGFLELKVGNENIYVEFLGEGHTCDNVIGYFPREEIMFGGCLIKELGAGKGNLVEASVEDWAETVKKAKQKYPKVKRIIPGHGKLGGAELLDYTIGLFE